MKQYSAAQLAALNAQYGTSFLSTDTANASDHLPVLSVFRISAVPEPGGMTIWLVAAGTLALFVVRRRFAANSQC